MLGSWVRIPAGSHFANDCEWNEKKFSTQNLTEMIALISPNLLEDIEPLIVVMCVSSIIYWLRIFRLYQSGSTDKEFGYGVYRDQINNRIFLYKYSQVIPCHLQLLSTHTSKDKSCNEGLNAATYLSNQLCSSTHIMFKNDINHF